jgi:hypothetical protein
VVTAKFRCINPECKHRDNSVEIEGPDDLLGKLFYCCWCGKVYSGTHNKKENESWLTCIAFKGLEASSTNGPQESTQTGETLWADTDGNHLTRQKYAWTYGWDPKTIWCNDPRNRNKELCKNFENRCKSTRSLILPLSEDNDSLVQHRPKPKTIGV